jgi:nicotinate-nucleotide adenylyltransferase
MKRIGIFGGSFNPIHLGHIGVALKAVAEYKLDKVVVVPAACNPFKDGCGTAMLRWVLVKYACAPYPQLEPWDFELRRGGVSYSIDTVRAVKELYPAAELFFIIGEDNVADVSRWKDADELARLVKFVPFPRTRESSTEVRQRLSEGVSISDLVPETVRDFLEAKGVVFDFGGVISVSPRNEGWPLVDFCSSLGISKESFNRSWDLHRAKWDGGMCSFEELYRLTFADAGLPPPTKAQLEKLWELDAACWVKTLSSDTLGLMKDLKAVGKKVAILSNMSEDFYSRLFVPNCAEYRALVDVEVISGFEKLVKPDRPIYDLTANRLGLAPKDLLFLDDTETNVIAARKWGWRSHVYKAES